MNKLLILLCLILLCSCATLDKSIIRGNGDKYEKQKRTKSKV